MSIYHKTYAVCTTRFGVNRRQILVSGGLLLLGGCQQITGCAQKNSASIRCERADLTADQQEKTIPVVYGERTPAEQDVLDTAIEDGQYETCKPFSEAFESLSESLLNKYGRQTDKSEAEYLLWPYVQKGQQFYETTYREGDEAYGNL